MAVDEKPDAVMSLLAPGERIVAQARRHWFGLIRDAFRPTLILGGTLAGFLVGAWLTVTGSGIMESLIAVLDTLLGLATLGLLIVGLTGLGVQAFVWLRQRYLVTDLRVVNARGLRHRTTAEAWLESITNVSYRDSFLGRRLGFAELSVVTAAGAPVELPEMVGAAAFKQAIMDAQEQMLRARAGEILGGAPGSEIREPAAAAEPMAAADAAANAAPGAPVAHHEVEPPRVDWSEGADEGTSAWDVPPERVQPSPRPASRTSKRATAPRNRVAAEHPAQVPSVDEVTDTLARLADLRDEGVITADDYESKKQDLLDRL